MSKARDTVETLRTVLVDGDVTNANFTGADLEVGKGGTGASSAGAARTALGVAIGTDVLAPDGDGSGLTGVDSLPSQTSQTGKFLTTNGSAASWSTVSAGDGNGTLNTQTFTSSGTWTKPADVQNVYVFLVAGGGGGGGQAGGSLIYGGGGGGGGGQVKKGNFTVTGNIVVTIGSGGSGGATGNGSNGGNSTLATGMALTVYGGGGGGGSTDISPTGNLGNMGGGGSSSGSQYGCYGGGGGGAGGWAVTATITDKNYIHSFLAQSSETTDGYKGAWAAQTTTNMVPSIAGRGIEGYGGGGGGAMNNYANTTQDVAAYDGGGDGGMSSSAGDNATTNSGGGGGGAATHGGGVAYAGGNGAAGTCIIQWWTA